MTYRQIPIKIVKMENSQGQGMPPLIYSQAFSQIACAGSAEGLTILEMAAAIEIKRAFDQAHRENKEFVLLDEEQWGYLIRKLKAHRFPFASEEIVEMVNAALNAEKE